MAPKPKTILLKLMSTAGTGFFYVLKKNPIKHPKKLMFKKYDPIVNQHVIFQEIKIKGKNL